MRAKLAGVAILLLVSTMPLGAARADMDLGDASVIAGITIDKLTGHWYLPPACWISSVPPTLDSNGRCTDNAAGATSVKSIPASWSTSPDPNRPHYNDTCLAVNAYVSTAVPPRGTTCMFSELGTSWNPDDPSAPVAMQAERGQVWDYYKCDRWKSFIGTDSWASSPTILGWYKDNSGATFKITRGTLSAINFKHDSPSTGWESWDASMELRGVASGSNGVTYEITWHLDGTIKASYNSVSGGCSKGEKMWDFTLVDMTGTGTVTATFATAAA